MNGSIDAVRNAVRGVMAHIARIINTVSRGRITPAMVTITSLLVHIPIALLIANRQLVAAALLLVIFGLFDALDGALARLQGSASNAGMVLDATTDRMKEVMLYIGIAYYLVNSTTITSVDFALAATVAACGGSLLVSYVKAKGETAVKDSALSPNEINRLFQDGFLRFEIRMFLLIVGMLFSQLFLIVAIIALLSWLTAFDRLIRITKKV